MKSCTFFIGFAMALVLSATGCESPRPIPDPANPGPGCPMRKETHVEFGFGPGGIRVVVTDTTTVTQPASQPAPQPDPGLPPLPPLPELPRGIGGQAPGHFGIEFVQTTFSMYGWETDDPNTILVDTDVLEMTFEFGGNPLHGAPLACGLPLNYGEPPPCEYENKITGVWVRQVEGKWRITSRGTLLQNARFQRDDLHICAVEGYMVPVLWNMLTPEEKSVARANGVTMTTDRGWPACGGMSLGRLSFEQPQSNVLK
jgi:hypothetical protein